MIKKDTHKIPNGFAGDAFQIASPGHGIPCADPKLPVLWTEGFAPEGLDIVSGTSIAVGINDKNFLEPASETVKPIGFVAQPLLGTKCVFKDYTKGKAGYSGIGSPSEGALNYAETMAQLTPVVYQQLVLLKMGMAYKKEGTTKEIFEIKPGDALRVIKSTEITTSVEDGTLPILFAGEKNTSGQYPKTKAMYAGRLVKWNAEKDKADEIVAKALGVMNPKAFDNYAYAGGFAMGADIQGPATRGLSRDIYNYIGTCLDKKDFITSIIEFKAGI